jgi:hypothetical protein
VGVLLAVFLASATVAARPRVQVAPFTVQGDDGLAYFGPEVGRAVTAALEGAGIETGSGAELAVGGRLESLAGERVRLTAQVRGRAVIAEGPLEALDLVATQLANRMVPLLGGGSATPRAGDRHPSHAPRVAAVRVTPAEVTAPEPAPKSDPPVAEAKVEPAKVEPAKAEPPAPAPKSEPAKSELARSEPSPAPVADAPSSKPGGAGVGGVGAAPGGVGGVGATTGPPIQSWRATPSPYFGGFVRGRVVAHVIADAPVAYPNSGAMATQALYRFLSRRLRLVVIPTGVGITAAPVAADEAYRAAARAVVMARLESVEYFAGPVVRCRLEVVVVRDGRPVMRRVVESPLSDPGRRGPGTDPVYQSVTLALESLVPELVGALADIR